MIVDLSPEEIVVILSWANTTQGEWGDLHPDEVLVESKLREALEAEDDDEMSRADEMPGHTAYRGPDA